MARTSRKSSRRARRIFGHWPAILASCRSQPCWPFRLFCCFRGSRSGDAAQGVGPPLQVKAPSASLRDGTARWHCAMALRAPLELVASAAPSGRCCGQAGGTCWKACRDGRPAPDADTASSVYRAVPNRPGLSMSEVIPITVKGRICADSASAHSRRRCDAWMNYSRVAARTCCAR